MNTRLKASCTTNTRLRPALNRMIRIELRQLRQALGWVQEASRAPAQALVQALVAPVVETLESAPAP